MDDRVEAGNRACACPGSRCARRPTRRWYEEAWAREAALPEPRPDPARPRPLGEQVCRALGCDPERAQAQISHEVVNRVLPRVSLLTCRRAPAAPFS